MLTNASAVLVRMFAKTLSEVLAVGAWTATSCQMIACRVSQLMVCKS